MPLLGFKRTEIHKFTGFTATLGLNRPDSLADNSFFLFFEFFGLWMRPAVSQRERQVAKWDSSSIPTSLKPLQKGVVKPWLAVREMPPSSSHSSIRSNKWPESTQTNPNPRFLPLTYKIAGSKHHTVGLLHPPTHIKTQPHCVLQKEFT